MARDFLDNIRARRDAHDAWCDANIYDNTTGEISGSNANYALTEYSSISADSIDSAIDDEATLEVDVTKVGESISDTFTTFANYDSSEGDDGEFLNINQVAGTVTGTSTAGFSYLLIARINMELAANRTVDVAVTQDDVVIGYIDRITGFGAGDPVSGIATNFVRSAPSGAVFAMALSADVATTADILDARLSVVIKPTNNP